jgi:hypothetical protein
MKWGRVSILLIIAAAARAQTVSGVVRDSTTRLLVAGVVVEMQDAAGARLGRTLSTAAGTFSLGADPRAAKLSLVRIGFRPRVVLLDESSPGAPLDIAMARLPTMLDRMDVVAGAKCDQRTNAAGQAFLAQARAGLLATIVGREVNPAKLVRLSYERTWSARPDTMMPVVRVDSVHEARTTFRAARRGADLVTRGFTADSLGTGVYFGPDAEVLLDVAFEAGYCFHVVQRRGQVGLGFSPASSRRIGRVDVEGTLWIDENERVLRSLEYRYVGLGREAESHNVGGNLVYQEMPNGTVMVTRWSLRLLKVRVDSMMYSRSRLPTGRIVVSEGGGMVARAEWPDGTKWSASLGTLEVTAVDGESNRRLPGTEVRLRNTNQAATTDQNGIAKFTNVFPGRYAVDVANAELEALGFGNRQSMANAGLLDSAVIRSSLVAADTGSELLTKTVDVFAERTARLTAPMVTAKQFAAAACRDPRSQDSPKRTILGHVVDPDGRGVDSVVVLAEELKRRALTRPEGSFVICVPDDWKGAVGLTVVKRGARSPAVIIELGERVTFARLGITP